MGGDRVSSSAMRTVLVETLRTFADLGYQRRTWVEEGGATPGIVESFEQNLSEWFDGIAGMAEDPFGAIGVTLVDEREARAVASFTAVLDAFYEALPIGTEDAELIVRPDWPPVVTAARETLSVVTAEPSTR